jgi:hypothetical protein
MCAMSCHTAQYRVSPVYFGLGLVQRIPPTLASNSAKGRYSVRCRVTVPSDRTSELADHHDVGLKESIRAFPPREPATHSQIDFTMVTACCEELNRLWVPSKVEGVVMADPQDLVICLRSVDTRSWLHLSWHPRAARVCTGDAPERGSASESYPFAKLARTRYEVHSAIPSHSEIDNSQ